MQDEHLLQPSTDSCWQHMGFNLKCQKVIGVYFEEKQFSLNIKTSKFLLYSLKATGHTHLC